MLRLAAFRIGFCYYRIFDALLKNELDDKNLYTRFSYSII
jgi:hypothetical protein